MHGVATMGFVILILLTLLYSQAESSLSLVSGPPSDPPSEAPEVVSDETEGNCVAIEDKTLTLAIAATTSEAKVRLTTDIIRDTQPDILLSIDSKSRSNPENNLRGIYTSLANHYGQRATEGGYKHFVEVANEISIAKVEACNGSSRVHPQDEQQLIQEFIDAYKMENRSSHLIRSLYGKILCHNSTTVVNRRVRRESLSSDRGYRCPPNGLDSNFTFCEFGDFYECLKTNYTVPPIFFGKEYTHIDFQCLAFVIDTTGSMRDEIRTAKKSILDFLRGEQDFGFGGCYILVPFNDVGPDNETVASESVGPITYAYSDNATQLSTFYKSVVNLRAGYIYNMSSHGGDGPEYSLYAMLQGLMMKVRDDHGSYSLMVEGSQMVVLTDAPSKQPELKEDVINAAVNGEVCIHFLVNNPSYALGDGIYQEIANKTHGTLLSHVTYWDIANHFNNAYKSNRCDFLEAFRGKRSDSSSDTSDPHHSQCKRFAVSKLAANLRLSIQANTGNTITISRPNGTISTLTVGNNNLAFFSETKPGSGQWSVCRERSTGIEFRVNDIVAYKIDTTILYNSVSSLVPPACAAGSVAIISSDHSHIQSASLDVVKRGGQTVKSISLSKGCEGAFISDEVEFPYGSYFYHLVGTDTNGIAFEYEIPRQITFKQPDLEVFSFKAIGDAEVEMDRDETIKLEFNLTNHRMYDIHFNFSGDIPEGFAVRVEPLNALLVAGGSVKVEVVLRVIHSSIRWGSSHAINVSASTCSGLTLSSTRVVAIKTLPKFIDNCDTCDSTCLTVNYSYLSGNFKRCNTLGGSSVPVCPPVLEPSGEGFEVIHFVEGSQVVSSSPPPACSYGRVGLASAVPFHARLVYTHINSVHAVWYGLDLDEICSGLRLIPSGRTDNFPLGSVLYRFEYRSTDNVLHTRDKVVRYEAMTNADYELTSVESGVADIVTSESKVITFRLRNPTAFTTKFTLRGSLRMAYGFQVNNLISSVVVYPQETVEIEATIRARTATVGRRNTFTLRASNGCVDLTADRDMTVINEQTEAEDVPTEPPTVTDECGGCLNGGECITRIRRGRTISRCSCPEGYGGGHCQVVY